MRLRPSYDRAILIRIVNATFYGPPKKALELLASDDADNGFSAAERACWRAFVDARARAARGKKAGAAVRGACDEHYRLSAQSGRDYVVRMVAALGDVDGAYDMMQAKTWDTWRQAAIPLWYPEMAEVRRDPRFMPMILPTGLPEYWLKSGNWPDFCRDDVAVYDCKDAAQRAVQNPRRSLATSQP